LNLDTFKALSPDWVATTRNGYAVYEGFWVWEDQTAVAIETELIDEIQYCMVYTIPQFDEAYPPPPSLMETEELPRKRQKPPQPRLITKRVKV
jgi:hypothetical protein